MQPKSNTHAGANNFPYPDPGEVWKKVEANLKAMTKEERHQNLIDCGILKPNGEVADQYKNIIKPIR